MCKTLLLIGVAKTATNFLLFAKFNYGQTSGKGSLDAVFIRLIVARFIRKNQGSIARVFRRGCLVI
jgi:hypothetical protein